MVIVLSNISRGLTDLEFLNLATYAIIVRGSEYDLPQDMLDDIVSRVVAPFRDTVDEDHIRHKRGRGESDDEADR